METKTIVNARRFDAAFYKAFKFESVEHAKNIIGESPSIKVYKNKKEYINSDMDSATAMAFRKGRVDMLPNGVPIAVIIQYASFYIPLDETKYLIYGIFPNYHGKDERRWEVLTELELNEFITIDEAEDVLHGKRN